MCLCALLPGGVLGGVWCCEGERRSVMVSVQERLSVPRVVYAVVPETVTPFVPVSPGVSSMKRVKRSTGKNPTATEAVINGMLPIDCLQLNKYIIETHCARNRSMRTLISSEPKQLPWIVHNNDKIKTFVRYNNCLKTFT